MTFWDDSCKDLSDKLWIYDDDLDKLLDTAKRKSFRCLHPHISFDYYDADVFPPELSFLDLPTTDNSDKKQALAIKLENKERKRFSQALDNKNAVSAEKKLQKHIEIMDSIDEKVRRLDGFVRSHKVKLLPDADQKNTMQQWFYDAICVYNRLVSHFTQAYEQCNRDALELSKKYNLMSRPKMLAILLKLGVHFPLKFRQLRELKIKEYSEDYYQTPYCIIADVIKEFAANVKGNITKLFKGQITEFTFKHRKHNRKYHSITIESHYTTADGFYPSIMGKIKTNESGFDWQNVMHDYKLCYDKYTKEYFVQVPKYVFPKEIDYDRKPFAVMDPGERKFQMLYGLDHIIKFGENMRKIIKKKLKKIDKLKEKLNQKGKWKKNKKLNKKTRRRKYRYKRVIYRIHKTLDGLQRELHYKTANYLCQNYDRIMVTDFSSKKVSKKNGPLDAMTKRVLGKLSHYQFRQRLQDKCQEYGCQYLEVSEHYTSKTCSNCGNIKHDLGDNEIYKCKECKFITDRDVNAAVCIFLKNHGLVLE